MSHHKVRPPSSGGAQLICGEYRPDGRGSAATAKGTVQHEWLEDTLRGVKPRKEVPKDELANVNWAYDYVQETFDLFKLKLETKVTILDDDFNEISFGTRDLWDGKNLGDFKSGEQHNYKPQMAYYVLGTCQQEGLDSVMVHEIYTKYFWVKSYEMTRREAQAIVDEITDNINKRKLHQSEYCAWCKKRVTCPVFTSAVEKVAAEITPSSTLALENLTTPDALNKAMVFAKRVRRWCDAVEAMTKDHLKEGGELDNFKFTSRKGSTFIDDLPKAMELTGLTTEEFLEACSVSNTSLVSAYAAKNNLKPADAKRELSRKLLDVTKQRSNTNILKECQA